MLYRPEQKNYGAIDFFLLERRKLSMFQVTIRNRHDINANELQRFYDDINVGERNLQDYCLFFVLPLGVAMTRKQNFIEKKIGANRVNRWTQSAHTVTQRRGNVVKSFLVLMPKGSLQEVGRGDAPVVVLTKPRWNV